MLLSKMNSQFASPSKKADKEIVHGHDNTCVVKGSRIFDTLVRHNGTVILLEQKKQLSGNLFSQVLLPSS